MLNSSVETIIWHSIILLVLRQRVVCFSMVFLTLKKVFIVRSRLHFICKKSGHEISFEKWLSFETFSVIPFLASLDSIIQPKIPFEFRKVFISGNMLKTSDLQAHGHSQLYEENKWHAVNSTEPYNTIVEELLENNARKIYDTSWYIRSGPHFKGPHAPSQWYFWVLNWMMYDQESP